MNRKLSTILGKATIVGAVALGFAFTTPVARAGQADDQIALQLGALQLGLTDGTQAFQVDNTNPEEAAQALTQGRIILKATSKSKGDFGVAGFTTNNTTIQSSDLRGQIYTATLLAVQSPQKFAVKSQEVTVVNAGKTSTLKLTASLDPKKTTASAIFSYAISSSRIPNFAPGTISDAITSALANEDGVYTFNYKDQKAALADVNKIAAAAMKAGLTAYARGTINWAGVPSTGTLLGATYLPNFGSKPLPNTKVSVSQQQAINPRGLANAASAISAAATQALNAALPDTDTAEVLAKKAAFSNLAASLVKGAATFQKTSLLQTSTDSSKNGRLGGAVAATGLALASEVAGGEANFNDNTIDNALLTGIIEGGVKGSAANVPAFATGVAGGFVAAYHIGGNDVNAFDVTLNTQAITNAFIAAKAKSSYTIGKDSTQLSTIVTNAINTMIAAINSGDYFSIAGSEGLNLESGSLDPVTDTTGL